jgi:phage terminase small subunit
MFKRPEVHEYYTQRRQELFDELEIDAITIAKQLSKIALAPEDDENTSNTHRIAAMNLLQKQLGLQTQRVESKVEGTITINVDVVDDGN